MRAQIQRIGFLPKLLEVQVLEELEGHVPAKQFFVLTPIKGRNWENRPVSLPDTYKEGDMYFLMGYVGQYGPEMPVLEGMSVNEFHEVEALQERHWLAGWFSKWFSECENLP